MKYRAIFNEDNIGVWQQALKIIYSHLVTEVLNAKYFNENFLVMNITKNGCSISDERLIPFTFQSNLISLVVTIHNLVGTKKIPIEEDWVEIPSLDDLEASTQSHRDDDQSSSSNQFAPAMRNNIRVAKTLDFDSLTVECLNDTAKQDAIKTILKLMFGVLQSEVQNDQIHYALLESGVNLANVRILSLLREAFFLLFNDNEKLIFSVDQEDGWDEVNGYFFEINAHELYCSSKDMTLSSSDKAEYFSSNDQKSIILTKTIDAVMRTVRCEELIRKVIDLNGFINKIDQENEPYLEGYFKYVASLNTELIPNFLRHLMQPYSTERIEKLMVIEKLLEKLLTNYLGNKPINSALSIKLVELCNALSDYLLLLQKVGLLHECKALQVSVNKQMQEILRQQHEMKTMQSLLASARSGYEVEYNELINIWAQFAALEQKYQLKETEIAELRGELSRKQADSKTRIEIVQPIVLRLTDNTLKNDLGLTPTNTPDPLQFIKRPLFYWPCWGNSFYNRSFAELNQSVIKQGGDLGQDNRVRYDLKKGRIMRKINPRTGAKQQKLEAYAELRKCQQEGKVTPRQIALITAPSKRPRLYETLFGSAWSHTRAFFVKVNRHVMDQLANTPDYVLYHEYLKTVNFHSPIIEECKDNLRRFHFLNVLLAALEQDNKLCFCKINGMPQIVSLDFRHCLSSEDTQFTPDSFVVGLEPAWGEKVLFVNNILRDIACNADSWENFKKERRSDSGLFGDNGEILQAIVQKFELVRAPLILAKS